MPRPETRRKLWSCTYEEADVAGLERAAGQLTTVSVAPAGSIAKSRAKFRVSSSFTSMSIGEFLMTGVLIYRTILSLVLG